MKKIPEFENEVLEGDSIFKTDIKINPDFYIHMALINAQKSLLKENTREGFLQYYVFIEHIETLAHAANMLPPDYIERLNEFKETDFYKMEKDSFKQSVKLANKKLNLIMNEIFNKKGITEPLKVGRE